MLTCKGVIQEISNYLDGNLDEEFRRVLESHLTACHHCRIILDTTRKTIELYCDGKLFPLPDAVRDRLHAVLRQKWQKQPR